VSVAPAQLAAEDIFPLVPRRRPGGLDHGPLRGAVRGPGSEVAGSRAYHPGDDIRTIDWAATARLSAARGATELIVRERYADRSPRVVLMTDRRPSMALYPPPWLSKPHAVAAAEALVLASAREVRAPVGRLVLEGDTPVWQPPAFRRAAHEDDQARFDAPAHALGRGLDRIGELRGLPPGTFVFVISDFLEPPPDEGWIRLLVRQLDVVPVIVQDATWESSFPAEVGGLVLPFADPATGQPLDVRIRRVDAEARRRDNEGRLQRLLGLFDDLGLDHVRITQGSRPGVLEGFLHWADVRQATAGRAW
jgi:uncharacterized protein (DUF58 family)